MSFVKDIDPELYDALTGEATRQAFKLELIASENFVSEAVLEAAGGVGWLEFGEFPLLFAAVRVG